MRRPTMKALRSCDPNIAAVFDALGLDLDELPHIIPDDVGDERFQQVLLELMKSKGWSEEDLLRPIEELASDEAAAARLSENLAAGGEFNA